MNPVTIQLPDPLWQHLTAQAHEAKLPVEQYIVFRLAQQTASAYEVKTFTGEEIQEQELRRAALRQSLGQPDMTAARRFLAQRETIAPESDLDPQTVARLRRQLSEPNAT